MEVPVSVLIEARQVIDRLTYEVTVRDSTIHAQRDYYTTLLELQDQRIAALEKLARSANGGPFQKFFENASWLVIGYGVRAATER